ncbi:MAG: GNAT family N-acetyltransferase [Candidatus Eisenbacteria bacterium]
MTIRPFNFSDTDYQALSDVSNAVWPDRPSVPQATRENDKRRDPKYYFQRLVVESGGEIIASAIYGESDWTHVPGKFFISMQVHPDHQRKGTGTALYDHVMKDLADRGPTIFESHAREDRSEGMSFLEKRGYKRTLRDQVSELAVADFDPAPFAWTADRMAEAGVEIRTVVELEADGVDWKRDVWELEYELLQDVPTDDPVTRQPFERWLEWLTHPAYLPEAFFIAITDGRFVGMTSLWQSLAEKDKLHTELTAVVRSLRRKGIATALKVRAIEFARDRGARVIRTDNEENNPMYNLNVRLGFRPVPAWWTYRKELNNTNEDKRP